MMFFCVRNVGFIFILTFLYETFIFSIILQIIESEEDGADKNNDAMQISVLNLVDLGGSGQKETGKLLKECSDINKSLLNLRIVIGKLCENPDESIKYLFRPSKLTRILEPSLGGNSKTAIICTIVPVALHQTKCTLEIANDAKKIKNKAVVNEVMSQEALIKRLTKRLEELEQEKEKARNEIDSTKKQQAYNILKETFFNFCPTPSTSVANKAKSTAKLSTCKFSYFGHQVVCNDEKFISILDTSFINVPTDRRQSLMPAFQLNPGSSINRKRYCCTRS